MMHSHKSMPLNPEIADVFYRAGYIERWGRGIQKICDACREHGADEPVYTVQSNYVMVKFAALASAIVRDPKVPKHQSTAYFGALDDPLVLKIIEILRKEPDISQDVIGERLETTRRVIQKHIKILKETGCIERVGGKRYGHWVIRESITHQIL